MRFDCTAPSATNLDDESLCLGSGMSNLRQEKPVFFSKDRINDGIRFKFCRVPQI